MRVKDCMCGEVCWVKPDTKVSEIAKIMNQNHIGCVPVCDDKNSLVGIITDRDIILRTIACDKDVKTTNASEIMTCNVCTCNKEDNIYDAELKMEEINNLANKLSDVAGKVKKQNPNTNTK